MNIEPGIEPGIMETDISQLQVRDRPFWGAELGLFCIWSRIFSKSHVRIIKFWIFPNNDPEFSRYGFGSGIFWSSPKFSRSATGSEKKLEILWIWTFELPLTDPKKSNRTPYFFSHRTQIRPGMELGRVMVRNSSTATDYEPIELELYPRELSERGILSIHPNVRPENLTYYMKFISALAKFRFRKSLYKITIDIFYHELDEVPQTISSRQFQKWWRKFRFRLRFSK